jgi:hypothetical protein
VPVREQAGEREPDLAFLAENDFSRLLDDALDEREGHVVRLCRQTVSLKVVSLMESRYD